MAQIDSPKLSEDFLALSFTARHARDLRYVAMWGRWLQWDSAIWKVEGTLAAYDLSRQVVRQHAVELAQISNGDTPTKLASAKTVAAVERLARADRHHAEMEDRWDPDQLFVSTHRKAS